MMFSKIRTLVFLFTALVVVSCGTSKKANNASDRQNFVLHKVVTGETPATLTEKYRLSIEDLRAANGGTLPALTPGKIIKVPKDKIGSSTAVISDPGDTMFDTKVEEVDAVFKKEINFAILLPFYLEYNSKLIDRNSAVTNEADFLVHEKSIPALEFYEGARIAQKELSLEGIKVNLNAIDTENGRADFEEMLSQDIVKSSDLLIGSFGTDKNELSVSITKQNKNDLVITKSFKANYLDNNDHVIIAHPSGIMQCKMMATYLQEKYASANIVIVNQENAKEENLAGIFKSIIPNHKSWSVPEYNEEKLYLEVFQQKLGGLVQELVAGKKNVVIIVSSSEFLVSRVMTKLYSHLREYDIMVCGLPTWQDFQSIDVEVMQELNLHYFTTTYLDKNNPLFTRFRKMYINSYFTEPGPDAFDGYSIVKYLGRAMYLKGTDFRSMLLTGIKDFNQQVIDYHYVEEGGGLENRAFYILKYEDYELKSVN